jgi:hypothetical protein
MEGLPGTWDLLTQMGTNLYKNRVVKLAQKHIILILLAGFLLAALSVSAQRTTLKGFVYDANTGQPIPFATISAETTTFGVSTDIQGYFHMEGIRPGIYKVQVRCVGYRPWTEYIDLEENRPVIRNFMLAPESIDLKEVNVKSAKETQQRERVTVSEISILPTEVELTPAVGGMPDLIQRMQVIPGVISRGDVGGQIYIRGGTPVQNKMLLDEAVIYNPVHSIGLFTVFDNDYIRNVDFHTGGFGAEYGGCISSVVNIATQYGNTKRISGKADLSTLVSKLFVEGPLLSDSTMEKSTLSFIFSVKNSHFTQAKKWFYPYLDQELPFHFLDLYSKLTLLAGKNLRINLFGFHSQDRVGYSDTPTRYYWKVNGFGGDIQLLPPRASMMIKAYFAGSFYQMTLEEQSYEPRHSNVDHLSFGFRFKRYLKNQTINYGLEVMNLATDYSYYSNPYNAYNQQENSTEISAYLQYHGRFGKLMVDPGIRFQHYASLSRSSLEPRLAIKFAVLENFRLKVAGGIYSQNLISAISDRDIVNFFHGFLSAPVGLVNEGDGHTADYYLQKSNHLIGGMELDFFSKLFINAEVYYKYYPQLLNFNKHKILNEQKYPDQPKYLTRDFIVESGYARGLDIFVLFDDQFRRLELGYSYAITKRTYNDPEMGKIEYYPQYDRRHNLNLSGSIQFGNNHSWEVNSRWNFGTGFPFTPSLGYYEAITFDENANINHLTVNGMPGIIYGKYNSARLQPYHRLDISVKKRINLNGMSVLEIELSIVNAYNRKNVFYTDRMTNQQVYQLPFLPAMRISVDF